MSGLTYKEWERLFDFVREHREWIAQHEAREVLDAVQRTPRRGSPAGRMPQVDMNLLTEAMVWCKVKCKPEPVPYV